MKLTGENRSTRRKTCPSGTLSTTNPTWTDPGLCGEKRASNRLSHGTAFSDPLQSVSFLVATESLTDIPLATIFSLNVLVLICHTHFSRPTSL
jgi:hypothetical protein